MSQWRGYADSAQGVALGFDFAVLKAATEQESEDGLIVRIGSVAYSGKALEDVINAYLQPVLKHYASGAMRPHRLSTFLKGTDEETKEEDERERQAFGKLFCMLLDIANYAYMVKAPFFGEEREWRCCAPK